jgi:hypothetical protein
MIVTGLFIGVILMLFGGLIEIAFDLLFSRYTLYAIGLLIGLAIIHNL